MHMDRYLHATSHHHPGQKRIAIKTLTYQAQTLADEYQCDSKPQHLWYVFLANGYTAKDMNQAINPRSRTKEDEKPSLANAFSHYVKGVTDCISKLLKKERVRTSFTSQQ